MEALIYIKKNHKVYNGIIDYNIKDELGHNYEFYKKLYTNENILKVRKSSVKNNELNINYSTYKDVYIPTINELKYINCKNTKLFFEFPNDNLIFIKSLSKLILNYTLKNLEKIKCMDVLINTYQPLKKIKLIQYKYNSYLINNIDNIKIKCPNIQYIKAKYYNSLNKNYINLKYFYNDNWNLKINCDINFHSKFPLLQHCPIIHNINTLNVILGYYCAYFNNINNLTININHKYKIKNFLIIIDENIKNLTINDNINILFMLNEKTNININELKIIKSFNKNIYIMKFKEDYYLKTKINRCLLNYYNKNNIYDCSTSLHHSNNKFINMNIKEFKTYIIKPKYNLSEDDNYFIYNKKN